MFWFGVTVGLVAGVVIGLGSVALVVDAGRRALQQAEGLWMSTPETDG